ncbi:hypothetical protein [Mesorhizobium sp. M0047]|uniref:hypothetical protein n=1 Tax=Mesorhizobium sp. M0047 TaxID=2956859 RepID=UPI00333AF5A2
MIVLIANAHPRNSEGIVASANPFQDQRPRNPEGIVAWAKSCAGFSPMSLAQKDQLLEIGSRVRLGKPIICGRLSVSRDKSQTFWAHEVRTNLLFTMSNRTGGELDANRKPFYE